MSQISTNFLNYSSGLKTLSNFYHSASKQKVGLIAFAAITTVVVGFVAVRLLTGRCSQNYLCYSGKEVTSKKIEKDKFVTAFSVVNQDTIEAALDLRNNEKVPQEQMAILDMANENKPGGYYEDDTVHAQEEQLIRRSPGLLAQLQEAKKIRNPRDVDSKRTGYKQSFIPADGCLFFKEVGFRQKKDDRHEAIKVATICSAALDLATLISPPADYADQMKNKIRAILYSAYHNKKTDLVLGAFGCGMFLNSPEKVALFFHEVLTTEFKGVFRNVVFAVFDTRGITFSAFEKQFKNGV